MSKPARWIVFSLLLAAVVALSFGIGVIVERDSGGTAASPTTEDDTPDFNSLYEIYALLKGEYVDPDRLDPETLYEAAINGMLKSLSDTGTFYVDPITYTTSVMPSGTFEGIGATVTEQDGKIMIVAPIKGTPADKAGIRTGDVILAVDGESTDGWNVEEAVLKIRGPKGTEVNLSIEHSDGETEDLTLTRDEIEVESVTRDPPMGAFEDADGNEVKDLAYVHIRDFSALTASQLRPVLEEIADGGYEGLVLDVRDNPGGLLDATVDVADMFLDGGTILFQVGRDEDEREFSAQSGGEATGIPMVVLVNRFSASGSEVLSAALKDNGRATIIGEKTFGKGTVNVEHRLSEDGGGLFVTIARWLTPDRVLIDGVGIHPDIEVIPSDEDIELRRDAQLLRAIDFLRGE